MHVVRFWSVQQMGFLSISYCLRKKDIVMLEPASLKLSKEVKMSDKYDRTVMQSKIKATNFSKKLCTLTLC